MKKAKQKLKPRNPVARSPLLRKSGAHRKSRGALRLQEKHQLKKVLKEQLKE